MGKPDEGPIVINPPEDSDSGSSSTGSTGSTSSSSGPNPADLRRPYREIIIGLHLPEGLYSDLISRAARERWGRNEFLWAITDTKAFRRMFPGIQGLLDVYGPAGAIQKWRDTAQQYQEKLQEVGLWGIAKKKMTTQNIGLAISRGIDPDELVYRVSIYEQAMRGEGVRKAFNAILSNRGENQLDKQGWFRFLLGKSDAQLYDVWEGTQLLQSLGDEGLRAAQARRLGRGISGPKGSPVDVSDVANAIERIRATLGSAALEGAGLNAMDLATAVLREGEALKSPRLRARADSTISTIQQLIRNAQAKDVEQTATTISGGRPISEAAPQGELAGA